MDMSKAFDTISHDILFKKLINRGTPDYIVSLLREWYVHQQVVVNWAGALSQPFYTTCGVRQGGILSALLFNVYMDDLSNELSKCNIGCTLGPKIINHVIYADDIVVFSPSLKGLQALTDICCKYMVDNYLKLNTKKTKCMKFEKKKVQPICNQDLYIGGKKIEVVNKIKYLGFYLTSNDKDDDHIEHLYRGLCGRTNMLLRIFGKCDQETKLVLFRSFCSSLYCISLISNFKLSTLSRLKVCHNTGLKMTLEHLDRQVPHNCLYSITCPHSLSYVG